MPSHDEFEKGVIKAMPALRVFGLSLTRNSDRADDLVQETALRALARRDSFEAGSNLNAWLFTILRNLSRSDYRKRKREVEDIDGEYAKAVPFDDNPLRHIEAKAALAILERLPDHFRQPLRLVADGATIEEIAAEMHEHDGTIKSRINRGREMLRLLTGNEA